MTDVTALARWLNRYVGAWRSNDPARIGSLFTEAAVYRGHPYDEGESLAEGREAIVRGWLEEPDAPESWEMTFEPLAASGELGIARCVTTYPVRTEQTARTTTSSSCASTTRVAASTSPSTTCASPADASD